MRERVFALSQHNNITPANSGIVNGTAFIAIRSGQKIARGDDGLGSR